MDIAPDNIVLGCNLPYLDVMGLVRSLMMLKHVLNKRPVLRMDYLAEVFGRIEAHCIFFGLFHHHGDISRRYVESFLVSVIMNACKNCVIPQLLDSL